MIVVLDTGALVSALIYPDRAEGRLLQTVFSGHYLAVSPALAAELGSVLARSKWVALIPNDPDDNHVVEAAVAVQAEPSPEFLDLCFQRLHPRIQREHQVGHLLRRHRAQGNEFFSAWRRHAELATPPDPEAPG